MTTVAEHLFDSSQTRRVWQHIRIDISAELAEVASYGGFFDVTVGGDPARWHPVGASYTAGYADLIAATLDRYHTAEWRIGASLVHLGHAARLWSPVLACVLAHGVIPDLTDLQRADNGAQLRLPEPLGQRASPSPELLYRVVVQEQMEPFAAGLRARLAPGLLYGNIASALTGSARMLLAARPDLREPITRLTTGLLETGELAGSGTVIGPDLGFTRNSCCLYYRIQGGGKCGDCPL
ncbi:iron reductase [Mycobacterium asiaticum]|uniref:Iron reductase n=1 Tax=Mycobacterium asiaticum TaxID=1790 RepID=A0A1A3NHT1_MYCAS|nr:iron reductase [Mycobacterium asiaticum]